MISFIKTISFKFIMYSPVFFLFPTARSLPAPRHSNFCFDDIHAYLIFMCLWSLGFPYERKQAVLVFCSIFIVSINFLMDTWAGSITWQLQTVYNNHSWASFSTVCWLRLCWHCPKSGTAGKYIVVLALVFEDSPCWFSEELD